MSRPPYQILRILGIGEVFNLPRLGGEAQTKKYGARGHLGLERPEYKERTGHEWPSRHHWGEQGGCGADSMGFQARWPSAPAINGRDHLSLSNSQKGRLTNGIMA